MSLRNLLPATIIQWLLAIWIPILLVTAYTKSTTQNDVQVSISARGIKAPASHGDTISFRWMHGKFASPTPAGWPDNDGVISPSTPAPLVWSGTIDHSSSIELIQNDHSGVIDISIDGVTTSFDLYSVGSRTLTVRLASLAPPKNSLTRHQALILIGQFTALLILTIFSVPAAAKLFGGTDRSMPVSKNIGYISRLDHLRFAAAFLVLIYHVTFDHVPQSITGTNPILALIFEGHTGVSLFMVLSGFIFGLIGNGKQISYRAFFVSRITRIFPLYLFAIFLAVSTQRWSYAPADIALLMFPIFDAYRLNSLPWFGQLWTIGVEFQFYAIFPFINRFAATSGVRYLVKLLLLSIAIKWMYLIISGETRDFGYFTILGRLDQFLIGMIAAYIYAAKPKWLSNPMTLIASMLALLFAIYKFHAAGGFIGTGHSPAWIYWPAIEAVCWAFLSIAYLSSSIKIPASIDRTLAYFGELSFSIYVMQYIAIIPFYNYIDVLPVTDHYLRNVIGTAVFLATPAVLMLAAATHEIIEKPFFSFKSKYTKESSRQEEIRIGATSKV